MYPSPHQSSKTRGGGAGHARSPGRTLIPPCSCIKNRWQEVKYQKKRNSEMNGLVQDGGGERKDQEEDWTSDNLA